MPDLASWQTWILFSLRLVLAVVGGLLIWFTCGPVIGLLLKLAYHKKPSYRAVAWGRVVCAGLAAFVIFLLVPIGGGGWGWGGPGTGGGGGSGKGPGLGPGSTNGTAKGTGKDTSSEEARKEQPRQVPFLIEMVVSERYPGGEKYYLLAGQEPPVTLGEVEEFLKKNKGKFNRVEVVVYRNSVARDALPTVRLVQLAERLGLPCVFPPQFWTREKKVED